jgi:hypothetical protein
MRINTTIPRTTNDTSGTVIGAQTSTRETKQDILNYTNYDSALSMIVNAPLHTFRYKNEVNGYGADSPLSKTRIGFIADEVDPSFMVGNVIDQVSVNGLLMASVKALNEKFAVKIQEFNLKAEEVNDITTENNLRSIFISWFGDVGNGIGDIFAGTFKAKDKLCINNTCVTESQLQTLLTNANINSGASSGEVIVKEKTPTEKLQEIKVRIAALIEINYTGESFTSFIVAKNTALSLPETNDEEKVIKTNSINDALSLLKLVTIDPVPPVDTIPPVITLNSESTITLTTGATYIETATATDDIDGDISAKMSKGGTFVDTTSAGDYTITYNVSDNAGNKAIELTKNIIVSDLLNQ